MLCGNSRCCKLFCNSNSWHPLKCPYCSACKFWVLGGPDFALPCYIEVESGFGTFKKILIYVYVLRSIGILEFYVFQSGNILL